MFGNGRRFGRKIELADSHLASVRFNSFVIFFLRALQVASGVFRIAA
jgi:hypothetical protein